MSTVMYLKDYSPYPCYGQLKYNVTTTKRGVGSS